MSRCHDTFLNETNIDVARQTRKFYLQANLLLHNFSHCSCEEKCVLFQTYCTNLYCCQLWFNSTKSNLKKLSTSHNSVLCRLLGICKPYSASKMFVSRGIPTFAYFIVLHNELSTVQIVLLVPHYRL